MTPIPTRILVQLRKNKTSAHRVCDSMGELWDWYVASEINDAKLHHALSHAVDDACNTEARIDRALTRITELTDQ